jgi:hypothetical protein
MTIKLLSRISFLVAIIFGNSEAHAQEELCTYGNFTCSSDSYCIQYQENKDVCVPKFQNKLKVIQYPFNVSAYCDQGPLSPPGNSHTWNNTAFAVDLKSTSKFNVDVLAGVNGTVIAFDECKTENDRCGLGYGNQVKILTEDNFIVFYAHLKKVKVKTGDAVKSGTIIGTEGITGWAGEKNKHLHLSVHYNWRSVGMDYWKKVGYLPTSVPFIIQDCKDSSYSVEELECKRVSNNPTMFCSN